MPWKARTAGNSGGIRPLYLTVYDALRSALHDRSWLVGELRCHRRRICRTGSRSAGSRSATRCACSKARATSARRGRTRPVVVTNLRPSPRAGWAGRIDRRHRRHGRRRAAAGAELARGSIRRRRELLGLPADTASHCLRSILVRDQQALRALDHLLSACDRITAFAARRSMTPWSFGSCSASSASVSTTFG